MARERKPLIEPGSVLPATDTLSRILERDRTTSGRRGPAASSNIEERSPDEDLTSIQSGTQDNPVVREPELSARSNITSNITANMPVRSYESAGEKMYAHEDAHKAAKVRVQKTARAEGLSSARKDGNTDARADAQRDAQRMAASRAIPITLRMPEELNDWLDEYAHSHRKQGVKKQDLIARAVQLLVVELEAEGNEDVA